MKWACLAPGEATSYLTSLGCMRDCMRMLTAQISRKKVAFQWGAKALYLGIYNPKICIKGEFMKIFFKLLSFIIPRFHFILKITTVSRTWGPFSFHNRLFMWANAVYSLLSIPFLFIFCSIYIYIYINQSYPRFWWAWFQNDQENYSFINIGLFWYLFIKMFKFWNKKQKFKFVF